MLPVLAFIHQRLAVALLAFALVLGLWGSLSFIRRRQVSGGYRSSFLLMTGLTAIQGLVGAAALVAGGRPAELLHLVYGAFAITFLPGVYTFAGRGASASEAARAREAAILAAAAWIVLIAYARGVTTGR